MMHNLDRRSGYGMLRCRSVMLICDACDADGCWKCYFSLKAKGGSTTQTGKSGRHPTLALCNPIKGSKRKVDEHSLLYLC